LVVEYETASLFILMVEVIAKPEGEKIRVGYFLGEITMKDDNLDVAFALVVLWQKLQQKLAANQITIRELEWFLDLSKEARIRLMAGSLFF
jgi:hypothetical protein